MEPVKIVTADGIRSGKFEVLHPPYACTTIRKELQCIHFNKDQIFHMAIMISKGPEMGMSGIVVTYDPHDPLYQEKYAFAKQTIANFSCFMHHWLIQCGLLVCFGMLLVHFSMLLVCLGTLMVCCWYVSGMLLVCFL